LETLKNCLNILKSQKEVDIEIIVVDNDSNDGTRNYLSKQDFKVVLPERNLGYGAAVNLGATRALGKYLFILNPDTEFDSSTLADLLRFAESDEKAGLISPLLRFPDGRIQLAARNFPGRLNFLMGRGSPLFKLGITDEQKAGYIEFTGDQPTEVPVISATAFMIKRELFEKIGGFDARYFLYVEDIDLCRAVQDRGMKIVILPAVCVIHEWGGSSRGRRYFALYHHHRSVWKYFRKHYPDEWFFNIMLLLALVFGFVVNSMLTALKVRGKN